MSAATQPGFERFRVGQAILLITLSTMACEQTAPRMPADSVYTLYRESVVPGGRVHIATFDTAEGESFNRNTCEEVRDVILAAPDLPPYRYWCEQGYVRP